MRLGRCQVLRVVQPARRVPATKHRGVDLQHQVQLLKIKQVDAAGNIFVNQRITFKHVVQNFIGQRVARLGEVLAELGKVALHLP